ncbi:MAG: aminotransferase class III-fold pyridoxal phosphate-dependent enzyme [Verrucomicrobiota bacterium]
MCARRITCASIEQEQLVEHARISRQNVPPSLARLAPRNTRLSLPPRGRGLMLAFDLPDTATRDAFWKGCYELGLLVVRCGERSIRLRPVLDVKGRHHRTIAQNHE